MKDLNLGTQFTCFTGTKVQILTQKALLELFPQFSPPLTRAAVKEGEDEQERGGGGGGGGRKQDDAAFIIKRGGFIRIVALEKEGALVRF